MSGRVEAGQDLLANSWPAEVWKERGAPEAQVEGSKSLLTLMEGTGRLLDGNRSLLCIF